MYFKNDIPENHGISSKAILDFLEESEADKDINLTNFAILSDTYILGQFCKKPYEISCRQLLFSLTKSFTSIGIGIAIDKGYLNLNDKVMSFFPKKLPEVISENLKKLSIRHLLTMTTGIHDNTYGILYAQKDWVKAFLAQEFPHEPGTYYRYSTHSSHMLSAIIEKTTGESLLEFLNKHLFEPLGISKPQWETCPMGIIAGGMGLSITTEDIAKFGILLLNKGKYFGKCIISEEYVNLATSAQVSKQNVFDDINTKKYSGHQYGYQFHIGLNGGYRADGAFGQICFISPKEKMVIVATSRNSNTERLLQLIYKYFLTNNQKYKSFNKLIYNNLQKKLSAMEYHVPTFIDNIKGVPQLNNSCYKIGENPNGIDQIIFNQNGFELNCSIIYHNKECNNLRFNFNYPIHDKAIFVKDIQTHEQIYISYASWENSTILALNLIYIETPYVVTYRVSFITDMIKIEFSMNVSLNLKNYIAWGKICL